MAGDRVHDDDVLLTRIRRADARALEALYDRYSGPVYSLAWGMLKDVQLAQEVTQDVFLAIWRGAQAFDRRRGAARTWILSLAHHKSVDAVRRSRRHTTAPLSDGMTAPNDVVAEAIGTVEADAVREALLALSGDQRAAIALAYYGGYTQREISLRLGVPLGTIKTRMRDGLIRLRGILGPGESPLAGTGETTR